MNRGKRNRDTDGMRRPSQRRLHVESLESRAMLAGNVLVSVDVGGNLRIAGDNADNRLTITQSGNGTYRIVGQATTINGQAGRVVTGVRRSLDVNLGAGDDTVTFTGALPGGSFSPRFTSTFSIRGGTGSDTITVTNVGAATQVLVDGGGGADILNATSVAGDAIVLRTSIGDDSITADTLVARELIQIETGDANDTIEVTGATAKRMTVNSGFGDDSLSITDTDIAISLAINSSGAESGLGNNGRGDSSAGVPGRSGQPDVNANGTSRGGVGGSTPITPSDADLVVIDNTTAGSASVATGSGDDEVGLSVVQIAGALVVVTGDGADELAIDNVSTFSLSIETGNGNDFALLANVAATRRIDINTGSGDDDLALITVATDQLFAVLGDGNDDVTAGGLVSAATRARIDGGSGIDSLLGDAAITAPLKELVGFESVS